MFVFLFRDGAVFPFPLHTYSDAMFSGTVISIHPTPNLSFTAPISKRLRQRDTGLRTSADPSMLMHALLDLSKLS